MVLPTLLSTFLWHISLSNGICSTRVRKLLFTGLDSKAVAACLHTSSGALLPGLPLPGHVIHYDPGQLCLETFFALSWGLPFSGPALAPLVMVTHWASLPPLGKPAGTRALRWALLQLPGLPPAPFPSQHPLWAGPHQSWPLSAQEL